jgi:histidinol-phosphate aminotransferase
MLNPKPGILSIKPYVGGESKLANVDRIIPLAANESALGPSPIAITACGDAAMGLHRYPDGGSTDLRIGLSETFNVDPEKIVCGSGSDELISLLVRSYAGPGDEVLYSQHGFLMYPISAMASGAVPVACPELNLRTDTAAMLDHVTDKTQIVFIANPNNPTGSYLSKAELEDFHSQLPDNVILAIDAAYAEYVTAEDYEPGIDLVNKASNVIMLRTFSKIFGLASLRLGWAYCSIEIADILHRVRGPFNVSAIGQIVGAAALKDKEHLAKAYNLNAKLLPAFIHNINAMGLKAYPSQGNFVLVEFPSSGDKTADKADAFLRTKGILVRGMSGYGLGSCLRVTIGTEEEMAYVTASFAEFVT